MTNDEAYSAAILTFVTAWNTITPTVPPVSFPNRPLDTATQAAIDAGATSWARVTYKPNKRSQQAIGGGVGGRLFLQTGIMMVEVYTPSGDGGRIDRTFTRLVERAFEGISTPNGLWFRNVSTTARGVEGTLHCSVVTVEWEYNEVR